MPYIPPNEDTVHFVGGIGTKADRDQYNGGGCTQVAWNSSGQLSDFMAANSGPKTSAVNATWTHSTKTVTATGIGIDVVEGTLAYLDSSQFTLGVYEVTIVVDDDNLEFAGVQGSSGDASDVTINVGGAIDKLQNALDNLSTSASSHNRAIYTNLNEDLTAAIDVDTGGGPIANNTKKKIVGFNTTPGDMDKGGGYYQGPLDAYINGIDTSKCVTYDAQGNAIDVFIVYGEDNIEFRNIYFYNTDGLFGSNGMEFSYIPVGIKLVNCKFSDVYGGVRGVVKSLVLQDCYQHQGFLADITSGSHSFIALGCVIDENPSSSCMRYYGTGGLIIGNLFVNGLQGMLVFGQVTMCYNTFYNQTVKCVRVNATSATLTEYNNIFMPAAVDDYAVIVEDGKGTILYSDYSWAFCSAGNFTVAPWYDATNDKSFMGPNSTKDINPQLVDAANGDFRPLNPDVLRGGRPDIAGNPGQIGMVIQKYRFAQRARQVNRGRLAIIR